MPWITNVSYKDIELGDYPDADVLIQIVCPSMEFPLPKRPVAEIQQLGAVVDVGVTMGFEDAKITDIQAANIILVLQRALEGNKNVLVHCVAEVRLKAEALANRKRLYEQEKALTPEEREKRKKLRSDATRLLAIAAAII